MVNNHFINSLRTMNEENIIYHIKNIKHTPIEIHILKKRLIDIKNNKITRMKEIMMQKKIMKQNEIIKKQHNELINQQIRFQNEILKEQNKQLILNIQHNTSNNQNKDNINFIDYPILTKIPKNTKPNELYKNIDNKDNLFKKLNRINLLMNKINSK